MELADALVRQGQAQARRFAVYRPQPPTHELWEDLFEHPLHWWAPHCTTGACAATEQ